MNRNPASLPVMTLDDLNSPPAAESVSGALPVVTANSGGCGTGCGCAAGGASSSAPTYWRSLDQYRGTNDFEADFLNREFPVAASEYPEGVSRRRWMQLMGASIAMVGAAGGCRYPEEKILPFVIRPEGRVPGEPYFRATNFELAGRAYNLLIQCVDGRPLKIEPNPEHPAGVGTDAYVQASMLTLYDPDRQRSERDTVVLTKGELRRGETDWEDFLGAAQVIVNTMAKKDGGSEFAILMSPTRSPSVARMIGELRKKTPAAKVCVYDSVDGDATRTATQNVFGKKATQVLDLESADVVVTLQADVLGNDKGMVAASSGFAARRDPANNDMNRLYVVEGGYTMTGASADARLAMPPSQMPAFLSELEKRIDAADTDGEHPGEQVTEGGFDNKDLAAADRLTTFLDVLAHDIAEAGDKAVVVVGDALGEQAVEAGIRLNAKLGSLHQSQKFLPETDEAIGSVGETIDLRQLVQSIADGQTKSLLILGDNPVFTSAGDVDLATAITSLEHSMYLGEYDDETGELCNWSAPMSHPLESWGDVIGDSGHYGVCQPQILPLLGGRSTIEVLAAILGQTADGESIVRRTADGIAGSVSNRDWRSLLHDGFHENLTVAYLDELPSGSQSASASGGVDVQLMAVGDADKDNVEVLFTAADGVYDGRFANNGWLQELPQALTSMCWDNAAVMSPRTAAAIGVTHGQRVALEVGDSQIELPVYEIPGCAPGVVAVQLGYGRTRAGKVGGFVDYEIPVVGFDVSAIRKFDARQIAYGVKARPRYNDYEISTTQNHWAIDELGRDEAKDRSYQLIREGTRALYDKMEDFSEALGPHVPPVGPNGSPWHEPINAIEQEVEDAKKSGKGPIYPQWGMSIDLSKCTGCNACVIACQSENNVPIVGREQVMKSREMHWLRIDRYFQGNEDHADIVAQPVACMHCETAPCEQVCPVAATVHTNEGINAMAYNRCIGTRYCANNCPFKVRRFNYFNYNEEVGVGYGWNAFPGNIESADRRLEQLVLNPEVTVRGRGVMEKCTYCTQRVERAKITARRENNGIVRDGDVKVACQTACPTQAIEFGNVADKESRVSRAHANVRSYGMLSQLNVKPRTEYLARVRNTPKALMSAKQLEYLFELEPPHHGGHGGHGDHEDHGHDHHGGGDHGHDDHGHDDHEHTGEGHGHDEEAHGKDGKH